VQEPDAPGTKPKDGKPYPRVGRLPAVRQGEGGGGGRGYRGPGVGACRYILLYGWVPTFVLVRHGYTYRTLSVESQLMPPLRLQLPSNHPFLLFAASFSFRQRVRQL
jgi:hypothetical protein